MGKTVESTVVTYYNIHSTIAIEDKIEYEEFTLVPQLNDVTVSGKYKPIERIDVRLKFNKNVRDMLDILNRKHSTDERFNLHILANQKLEVFFYKLTLLFNSYIYVNYPMYIMFSDSPQLYRLDKPTDFYMKPLVTSSELDKEYVYKETNRGNPISFCIGSIKQLRKILKKQLHLCYLYYTIVNNRLDLNLRLLSAWKYLEEYVELRGEKVQEYKIPECIFQKLYKKDVIEVEKIVGLQENGSAWLHVNKYRQQFLTDFRNEIRLPIAHHKRDVTGYVDEKKYTPRVDIKRDLRMHRALTVIIPFINQLNVDLFQIFSQPSVKVEKKTSKYINFPKRL